MPTGEFHFDFSEFEKAFDIVQQATGKSAPEILNRAGLHAIIGGKGVKGAMQRTPRATRAAIKAVDIKVIARIVMARAKKKGEKLTRVEIAKRIQQEYASRLSAISYTAGPGWNNAAIAFGGRGVKLKSRFSKSLAKKGRAKLATIRSLVAEMENAAPAADKIGRQALQDALNDEARDMVEFGERKMQQAFDKVKF